MDLHARAVILATGASYRRLGVPSLEELIGAGVYYGGTVSEAVTTTGENVLVAGGANSAGQAALRITQYANHVTLVVRGDSLDAGMSHYLVRQLEVTPNVDVRLQTEIVDGGADQDGWLDYVVLRTRSGDEERLPADEFFVMIGADPHTDWLPPEVSRDARGFILTGADVPRDAWPLAPPSMALETSMPSVLAVGDARYGSVKRVASAAGEGSAAIQALHRILAAAPQGVGWPARPKPQHLVVLREESATTRSRMDVVRCPFCSLDSTRVVNSRLTDPGDSIRRGRECAQCGNRFTQHERAEEVPVDVVKRDGTTQRFDRRKLLRGLVRSARDRPGGRRAARRACGLDRGAAARGGKGGRGAGVADRRPGRARPRPAGPGDRDPVRIRLPPHRRS